MAALDGGSIREAWPDMRTGRDRRRSILITNHTWHRDYTLTDHLVK